MMMNDHKSHSDGFISSEQYSLITKDVMSRKFEYANKYPSIYNNIKEFIEKRDNILESIEIN
jgi:hypothetical protein